MICHVHHKILSSYRCMHTPGWKMLVIFFFFFIKLKEAKSSLWIDCFTNRLADQPMLIV